MKTLIITIGLPRSGKSTWSRSLGYPIVNPDSIRLALHGRAYEKLAEPFVWAIAKVMIRALFLAGHSTVVLDATNATKGRRKEWVDSEWTTFYRLFNTPKEECINRAKLTDREYLIPIIEDMNEKWEAVDQRVEEIFDIEDKQKRSV